jgi:two-component system sensor histidine kinase UhpB
MVAHVFQVRLFWRVFTANAVLLLLVLVALLVTPVTVSAPIRVVESVVLVSGFILVLAADLLLLRRAFAPLERLAQAMEHVDLLRPGQRVPSATRDDLGRLVHAFNQMLDRLEDERHETARRALAAQEAERKRIARGLHDEVGQVLTGVLLQLDAVEETSGDVARAKESVRHALEEVRRISRELRPEMLEHLGLTSALTELSRSFDRLGGIRVESRINREPYALAPDVELAIYRIAQESLTNVLRHARAGNVEVTLGSEGESVVLRVIDDGCGFEHGTPPAGHGGLRGMRERAVLIGGQLAVEQAPSGGVEVRLEVPAQTGHAPSPPPLEGVPAVEDRAGPR